MSASPNRLIWVGGCRLYGVRVVLTALFFSLGFGSFIAAEDATLKELEAALSEATGAERLEILNELANGLCLNAPDAAVVFGLEAAELAREIKDRDAEGYALKTVGIAHAVAGEQDVAIDYSSKALALFEATGNRIQVGKVLNNLGISYRMIDRADQALEYYERAMVVEEELENPKGIARTLGNIANVHLDGSRYDEALVVNQRCLAIAREIADEDLIASTLNNIGTIHLEQGRYEEALTYLLQAVEIYEAAGNALAAGGILSNIGHIKADLGLDEEALLLYGRALATAEEIGDRVRIGSAQLAIGSVMIGRNEHDTAVQHFLIARRVFEESGHLAGVADVIECLGLCERAFGNLDRSLELHREALEIRMEIGGGRAIANIHNNIGRVLAELGDVEAANDHLQRGLELAVEVDAREIVRDATWHLYGLEKTNERWRTALEYLEHHNQVKDQLLDEFTRDAVARAEARFEADKREQEIMLLQRENEIQRLEASRASMRTYLLVAILVIACVGLAWLLRKYRSLLTFWKHKSHVGHYRIVDRIASGGMGVVYRAENLVEGSEACALKVIREENAADEVVRKRFLHEAAIVDQLDHPHIVKVHERGEHDGRLFMAMELLEGPSLAEIIRDDSAALPVETCRHIMIQLVDVVRQIHSKGVLHRDLKPENVVLVERAGDPTFVKLLDFGLARTESLTRLTQSGMIIGTLSYLAPEQITDQRCSTASDIYSLGVIFYELLTAKPAFPGEAAVDIIKEILDSSPVPPRRYREEIGRELNDLVIAMLAKDPDDRPKGDEIAKQLRS